METLTEIVDPLPTQFREINISVFPSFLQIVDRTGIIVPERRPADPPNFHCNDVPTREIAPIYSLVKEMKKSRPRRWRKILVDPSRLAPISR